MASYTPKWDLTTIPEDKLKSEWARRSSNRRKVKTGGHGGGRPPQEDVQRCPCGKSTLTRAKVRGYDCCKKKGVIPR